MLALVNYHVSWEYLKVDFSFFIIIFPSSFPFFSLIFICKIVKQLWENQNIHTLMVLRHGLTIQCWYGKNIFWKSGQILINASLFVQLVVREMTCHGDPVYTVQLRAITFSHNIFIMKISQKCYIQKLLKMFCFVILFIVLYLFSKIFVFTFER